MDFARETSGHTARAACGHTLPGARSGHDSQPDLPHLREMTLRSA